MKLSERVIIDYKTVICSLLRIICVTSVFFYSSLALPNLDEKLGAAANLITLSGILIGFLMTAISLLVASADRPFLVKLRKTGHFQRLISDFANSSMFWMCVIFLSLSCYLVKNFDFLLALALASMVYSLMYFVSAMRELKIVIEGLAAP